MDEGLVDDIESPHTPWDHAYWEADIAKSDEAGRRYGLQGARSLWRKLKPVRAACRMVSVAKKLEASAA